MSIGKVFERLCQGGQLIYYPSESHVRCSRGVQFSIRYCRALQRKPTVTAIRADEAGAPRRNPFLPPEPELVLTRLGADYQLIFNKFCVVPQHLLIISNDFVGQDSPLVLDDFAACASALRWLEADEENDPEGKGWLLFYNSGPNSGASQPHRHLQIIAGSRPPIFADSIIYNERIAALGSLRHQAIRLAKRSSDAGEEWFEAYQRLQRDVLPSPDASYNLLFTKELMLMVPRQREYFQRLSFNAMAFAGYLLATCPEQLEMLLDPATDPFSILETLCMPPERDQMPSDR